MNEWAVRYFENGLTPIPINTKTNEPHVKWSQYKENPPRMVDIEEWINQGLYNDGVAQLTGLCHRGKFKGLYLNCVDFDSPEVLDKLLAMHPLEELSNAGIFCEQHTDNKGKAHVWVFSTKPFPKLAAGHGVEVKSDGMLCNMFPSIHKSGNRYFPIGNSLKIFSDGINPQTSDGFVNTIDKILDGKYLNGKAKKDTARISIDEKWRETTRNNKMFNYTCDILRKIGDRTPVEIIKSMIHDMNQAQCEPPLPDDEVKEIFRSALGYYIKPDASEPITVAQAKRLHSEEITVIGIIISVSEIYQLATTDKNGKETGGYRNAKSIQLENHETFNANERLDVVLYDDMTNNVVAGEAVKITGKMSIEDKKPNSKSKKKFSILHATSIEYLNRKEISVTEKDIKMIQKFVFDCKFNNWDLMDKLTAMFAPNIIGHNDRKRGVLRSIVGGADRGEKGDGRISTLMAGDPGTAKSELGKEAVKIKPNSRHVDAPHATTKTITAVPEKVNDNVTLVLGAIPLSKGAICSIDEINSFSMEDQSRILSVLDNRGIINVDKMGMRCEVPAATTIIATANPVSGKWNNDQIATREEIELKRSLIDRFTQIYASRDNMSKEQTKEFVEQISKIRERRQHNYKFLEKYLIHASSIKDTKFTPDAKKKLNQFWADGKTQNVLSIRMYEGIFKMAEAQAKLHLSNVVDEEIVDEVIEDMKLMMVQYGEIITSTLTAHEIAFNTCLEVLRETKAGMTVESMRELHTKRSTGWSLSRLHTYHS